MNIQWYPGHMTKAKRQMVENAKRTDAVMEVVDARIPFSSRNPDFDQIFNNKRRIVVLNKADLADPSATKRWIAYYKEQGIMATEVSAVRKNDKKRLIQFIQNCFADKIEANKQRGVKKDMKLMVVGIPNSGKSTVINLLGRSATAKTGNRPGVTKGQQLIRVTPSIVLLDTPGVLWPKFDDEQVAMNLALTGAIREQVLDIWHLAIHLIENTTEGIRDKIKERYKVDALPQDGHRALEVIAKRRGLLVKGGELDMERAAQMILTEFKNGVWGKITLEEPGRLSDDDQ